MNTSTIVITDVETKEGTSAAGKPWKMFKLVDQGGNRYATFDGGLGQQAFAAKGQQVEISYEITDKGNNLKTLRVTGNVAAPAPAAAPPAAKPNGDTDWDLIGLRKTRCALWAALLSGDSLHGMPATTAGAFAREVVIQAERDIFHRDPVSADDSTDDIPF